MSKEAQTMQLLGQILYAIGMAQAIDSAPFDFNPHKLRYTHYRCVWCFGRNGTRSPCECRSEL